MYVHALLNWLGTMIDLWKPSQPHTRDLSAESGQGLVEYALILIFVGVVVMALLIVLGPTISNMFSNIMANVETAQH